MVSVIEGKFGLGYRQSPYLFNNVGFNVGIAEGNSFEGVNVKSDYVLFFEDKKKFDKISKGMS